MLEMSLQDESGRCRRENRQHCQNSRAQGTTEDSVFVCMSSFCVSALIVAIVRPQLQDVPISPMVELTRKHIDDVLRRNSPFSEQFTAKSETPTQIHRNFTRGESAVRTEETIQKAVHIRSCGHWWVTFSCFNSIVTEFVYAIFG